MGSLKEDQATRLTVGAKPWLAASDQGHELPLNLGVAVASTRILLGSTQIMASTFPSDCWREPMAQCWKP
jgi:hypothetical protein